MAQREDGLMQDSDEYHANMLDFLFKRSLVDGNFDKMYKNMIQKMKKKNRNPDQSFFQDQSTMDVFDTEQS